MIYIIDSNFYGCGVLIITILRLKANLIEELFNREAMSDDMYTKAKKTIDKVHGDGIGDVDTAYNGNIKQYVWTNYSAR